MENAAALWVGISASKPFHISHPSANSGSHPKQCHFHGSVQDTNDWKANSLETLGEPQENVSLQSCFNLASGMQGLRMVMVVGWSAKCIEHIHAAQTMIHLHF